jgi:hypothetical protein
MHQGTYYASRLFNIEKMLLCSFVQASNWARNLAVLTNYGIPRFRYVWGLQACYIAELRACTFVVQTEAAPAPASVSRTDQQQQNEIWITCFACPHGNIRDDGR